MFGGRRLQNPTGCLGPRRTAARMAINDEERASTRMVLFLSSPA
jgi:hypothetical protein